MIKKTFYLLILFLLVFLAAHMNTQYFPYIGITAVLIIILCLGYAIHKTKLFYYSKKVIVFLLFSLSFFYLTSASPVLAQTSETTQSGGTFFKSLFSHLFSQDAKPSLEEQIQKVGNEFHKIWRILPETRTEEQQKKYDQLKKQLENLLKKKAKEDKKEKANPRPRMIKA